MKNYGFSLLVLICTIVLLWASHNYIAADSASDLDAHKDVKEAYALADASSGICAEVSAAGAISVADANTLLNTGRIEGLYKLEDAAHSSGDPGLQMLTVRQDSAAALGGTDGDYQPAITDANGRLHTLDANSAAIKTAAEIMDDWDDSDTCSVSPDGKTGVVKTASGSIKTSAAKLFFVYACFDNVTAGDSIYISEVQGGGTKVLELVAKAADCSEFWNPCVPIDVATGLYVTTDLTGGAVTVNVVYE